MFDKTVIEFQHSRISPDEFESKRKELEDIMVAQLRELDAEFNLYVIEQGLKTREFKRLKKQGLAPKLTKRYH